MTIAELLHVPTHRHPHRTATALPSRAVVAVAASIPAALLVGWVVADAVQPASYSPLDQTVSVTAGYGGAHRWVMSVALLMIAAGYLAVAALLDAAGRPARAVLAVAGVAGLGIATNPVPVHGTNWQHDVWTIVGAVAMTGFPLAAAARSRTFPQRPDVVAVTTVVFVALGGWLIAAAALHATLGLAERIGTTVEACWPAVVALALRRSG